MSPAESLAEMPDVTDEIRFRRAGDLIRIDADLLAYFGSAEAVNEALREVVSEKRER